VIGRDAACGAAYLCCQVGWPKCFQVCGCNCHGSRAAGWLAKLLLLLLPPGWHPACCSVGGGTPSKTRQGSLASAGGSIKPTAKEQGRFKVYEGDEPPPFRCAPHRRGLPWLSGSMIVC
jgi:hypothetical protein